MLFSFLDEINILKRLSRQYFFSHIPKCLYSPTIKKKRSLTIRAVVKIHPFKDFKQYGEGNVTNIHIIKIHNRDILFVMIRIHPKVHKYKHTVIDTVKILQHLLLILFVHFELIRSYNK